MKIGVGGTQKCGHFGGLSNGHPHKDDPTRLFAGFEVDVHGLKADFAGAGGAIPDELAEAGEGSGGEALELGFHLDALVFVDPAAGLGPRVVVLRRWI